MLEKVKETVAEALGADIDTITAETSFKEDLGADSLDLFEMVHVPSRTPAAWKSRPRIWKRW